MRLEGPETTTAMTFTFIKERASESIFETTTFYAPFLALAG